MISGQKCLETDLANSPYLTETQKQQAILRKTRITRIVGGYEFDLLQLQISNNTLREKLESNASVQQHSSPSKKIRKCGRCGFNSVKSNNLKDALKNKHTVENLQNPENSQIPENVQNNLNSKNSKNSTDFTPSAQPFIIKQMSHELEQLKLENKKLSEKLKKITSEFTMSQRTSDHFRTELLKASPRKNPNKFTLQMAEEKLTKKDKEIERLNRALQTSDNFIKELQEKLGEESSPDSLKEVNGGGCGANSKSMSVFQGFDVDSEEINAQINSLPAMRKLDFSINKHNRKTPINNELLPNTNHFNIIQELRDDEMSKDSIGPELFTSNGALKVSNVKNHATCYVQNSQDSQVSQNSQISQMSQNSKMSLNSQMSQISQISQISQNSVNSLHSNHQNSQNSSQDSRVRGFTPIQDLLDNDNAVDSCTIDNKFEEIITIKPMMPESKSDPNLTLGFKPEIHLYKPVPRSQSCPPTNLPFIRSFVIGSSIIKSLETIEDEENKYHQHDENKINFNKESTVPGQKRRFRQHSGPAILGKNSESSSNLNNPPSKRSK